MKEAGGYSLATISLDPRLSRPLHRQLYESMRSAILSRQLRAGTRLPSTRSLADDLGISRNTVLAAFDQLTAEGYLDGKTGSGTYVAATIPDDLLSVRNRIAARAAAAPPQRIAKRTAALPAKINTTRGKRRAFEPGLPALDLFPVKLWGRLVARQWTKNSALLDTLGYGEVAGHPRLREAIAHYVGAARGVQCDAAQVIITYGIQHAIDIAARVLIDPGDAVWFEEPGYTAARGTLIGAGARLVFVPVDSEGMDVAEAVERCATPRLIYVTPSHQFPLGVTMPVARRLQLLDAARRAGAWILEDDYDSEYRHTTRPVPSIQGLDSQGRVIYLGTFSKVLFPALRLGYMVVPPALVDTFLRVRLLSGRRSPAVDQLVVADFIEEGHFERHIRRMRAVYRERQEALLDAAAKHLHGIATVSPSEAGMHTMAWLDGLDDAAAAEAAAREDIETAPLSAYCAESKMPSALVLGYGAVTPRQIRVATEKLARALEHARKGT